MKLTDMDLNNIEALVNRRTVPGFVVVHENDFALMIAEIRRLWAGKRRDEQAYRRLQKLYDDLLVTDPDCRKESSSTCSGTGKTWTDPFAGEPKGQLKDCPECSDRTL